MKKEYIEKIIEAIKMSNYDAKDMNLDENVKFSDIPGMDSMSIVNFQMDLASIIGPKAEQVQPNPDMTIGDLADILVSL